MNKMPRNKKTNVSGIVLTVIVTLGFIWAILQWFDSYDRPQSLTIGDVQANEAKALENLQLIAQAQDKYRQQDWDADGKKTYARFLVHLWTSINKDNKPVLVKLIPRSLGFAMGPTEGVDGYYFVDLRSRGLPEKGRERKLDYEKEWAVAAVPAAFRSTGLLVFLADSSGRILAKNQRLVPVRYPHDPLSNGWIRIESAQQLTEFQGTIDYTQR